jgi:PPE-repeat protein
MTTPEQITQLKENQIFVFGSNLSGNHAGGAAKLAADKFGAVDGVGEGITGQSYAFPTLDKKMKPVTKKALKASKELLYKCAVENTDKQFLVTKVGCGIAGFTEDEMKKIFTGEKPNNIILPAGWSIVRGYKAFDKGLKCRGYQYEFGKDFYHEGKIELCQSGFHFCKSLGDVYSYYNFGTDIEVCEVESEGDVIDEEDGNKSVTNHLRIVRMLNPTEASNNNGVANLGHSNTGHSNTGDRNTGHSNTGNWNTGHSNTGNWNTGDRNTGNWNTGDSNTGDWNTANYHVGAFNTEDAEQVYVFNKLCSKKVWDEADKPSCLYFEVKKWVYYSDMTDEEKKQYPASKTAGGYVKEIPYKEAFTESMKKASAGEIKQIKALPNFDAKLFEEISGFKIE